MYFFWIPPLEGVVATPADMMLVFVIRIKVQPT
jgi:hypothetical protein